MKIRKLFKRKDKSHKFKVGDKVKISKKEINRVTGTKYKEHLIGKIIATARNRVGNLYQVDLEYNRGVFWVYGHHLIRLETRTINLF